MASPDSSKQDPAELRAAVARIRALAADMRTWCSPHGIASDYADRIEEALGGHANAGPRGGVIEIIEKGRATSDATIGESIITPNDVRINGQSLLASADDPVVVHEVSTTGDELVRVTLTLFARRVTIAAEGDLP
jgi:hypothetical protein